MQVRVHPQVNMNALVARVQPREGELVSARRHLGATRIRLAKSFDVSRIVPIGSHARGTAIRAHSDLDMMVVIRRNNAKWGGNIVSSYTLLGRVREDLQARYVNTDIRTDQQAVVVDFASGQQSLDVVPALFRRFEQMRPVYQIPDGLGEWFETSPELHDRYFANANQRSGGKLRRVVQLLKWWKFSRAQPVPIRSFHMDILLASSDVCVGVKPYTHCLYQAFDLLAKRECRGLRDPLGTSGVIYAASTQTQWENINNAVAYALDHASAAVAAEAVRNLEEANRQWGIVFNGEY
jgi:predicted nucleotidyltransferase